MPTDCLFREDSYLKECSATVVGLTEAGGIVLDRTVFYAASGGQPADRGVLTTATGDAILIENATFTDAGKTEIAHLPAATTGLSLKIGEPVHAMIDLEIRYARMRMHTALHLLSAVLPYPVTGGAVRDTDGRLDFDIPEAVRSHKNVLDVGITLQVGNEIQTLRSTAERAGFVVTLGEDLASASALADSACEQIKVRYVDGRTANAHTLADFLNH